AWKVTDSKNGALDANAAEAWLATNLPRVGATLDPNDPVFVVLHGGAALGKHTWRHTFSHGYIEPVRVFGEHQPLTIFDASATPDPYVVGPDQPSPLRIVSDAAFGAGDIK